MDIRKLTWSEFWFKLRRKLHTYRYTRDWKVLSYEDYCNRYPSYRYSIKHPGKAIGLNDNYITARPNPGAGIGHQMANWMAGFYAAKFFNLKFAHIPFANQHHPLKADKWETFLGFGLGRKTYTDVRQEGYKTVLLPLFNYDDMRQVEVIRGIISAYANQKAVFFCEQDQFLRNLPLVMEDCQRKFEATPARKNDRVLYTEDNFNIAIHIRRGDIMTNMSDNGLTKRILGNDYYYNVLQNAMRIISTPKPIHVYLFSQGRKDDYPEFSQVPNLHWCLDMDAISSFLHFVRADLLITSRSSFSYKPALLNREGVKLVPDGFWHSYPNDRKWIVCNNQGDFNEVSLLEDVQQQMKKLRRWNSKD